MPSRLPPLNSLRMFEAAARHLSFKKAAAEMNVTPAAVSHQLQQLEDFLGVRLFRRLNRGLELTGAAQACLPRLIEGFEALRQSVDRVREHKGTDVLSVSAPPSFANRWLMLRLHRFVAAHPDIDVRVSTRMRQFARQPRGRAGELESVRQWTDEYDVVIVFGNGGYPGVVADKLLPLSITPLCSPRRLRGRNALRKPADLRHHPLLHDDRGDMYNARSFWDLWLKKAGVSGIDTSAGPHFSHSILALEAAIEGLGVVASTPVLAAGDISAGRLVAPFALAVPLESNYYVLSSEPGSRRAIVEVFRAWLLGEAGVRVRKRG